MGLEGIVSKRVKLVLKRRLAMGKVPAGFGNRFEEGNFNLTDMANKDVN